MKNVSFMLWINLNGLFGQPNTTGRGNNSKRGRGGAGCEELACAQLWL